MAALDEADRALLLRPPTVTNDKLARYWDGPVAKLFEPEPWRAAAGEKERHRLYARCLMQITYFYWNGYKRGREGDYPWNDAPGRADPVHLSRDYYGHNIAALAVDAKGYVLDFEFNHNEVFNSSAEHAEARLVRRLYSLAQLSDSWGALPESRHAGIAERRSLAGDAIGNDAADASPHAPPAKKSYTSLKNVTIYTTLESCAQCAGTMALAQVSQVVYLQTDPGTFWIGRILRNLTVDELRAPLPISGSDIGLGAFERLDQGFLSFAEAVERQPFWVHGDKTDSKKALTSYLCTREARAIFKEFGNIDAEMLAEPGYAPLHVHAEKAPAVCTAACALTNDEVRAEAKDFYHYATERGRRATPHNL